MYIKDYHQLVSADTVSTTTFESISLNVLNSRSHALYSIIVVYKAPSCCFETFKKHIISLSESQLSDKLIIVGDFNFDLSNDLNKTSLDLWDLLFQIQFSLILLQLHEIIQS